MVDGDLSLSALLGERASDDALSSFCRRWRIRERALFGSALREDFSDQSDLDFLVMFDPQASWSLIDHMAMERKLEAMLGRPVEIITRRAIEASGNYVRRREILFTARALYAA